MTDFMIMDDAGNAVDDFGSLELAVNALAAWAQKDPEVVRTMAIFAFDGDTGDLVGEPLTLAEARPDLATQFALSSDAWLVQSLTIFAHRAHPRRLLDLTNVSQASSMPA